MMDKPFKFVANIKMASNVRREVNEVREERLRRREHNRLRRERNQ